MMKHVLPLFLCLWATAAFGQATLNKRVASSTDDAEELSATEQNSSLEPGDLDIASSDLELTDDASWNGTGQTVGLRFVSIDIPKGAVITDAHLEFTVKQVNSEPTSLEIRAEAIGDAATFENSKNNISSRPTTTEVVEWNEISVWNTVDEVKTSPDVAELIKAVMARSDWEEGNPIAFIITGSGVRAARSFDGNADAAPKLVVNYLTESIKEVPELVNSIPDQELKTGWGFSLDVKPFFVDGDSELTFSATGPEGTALPASLSFSNGVFSGAFNEAIVLPVTVTAESDGDKISDQFLIFVEPQQSRMLTKLSTLKLGAFDEGAAEISTFDETTNRLYVTNAEKNTIDIIDMADPSDMQYISSIDISTYGGGVNSVDTYNGILIAAIEGHVKTDNGFVYIFDSEGTVLASPEVGALPDMVTFNEDGTKILVANEGEPNDDYSIDPEGSISIIDFATKSVTTADFASFNGMEASLAAEGIRIFGPGATVAQDLEPEYITVKGNTAYVTLQENNAIAVVDISNAEVVRLIGLGYKDYSLPGNGLDVPDLDDIYISNWPLKGIFMPDAIDSYEVGGVTYLITANEGDSRDYKTYSEESEIGDVVLDVASFPYTERLQEVAGGLKITTAMADTTATGEYKTLYTFGTRSFTIWNAQTGEIVFESGDMLEQITASIFPENFNASNTNFKFKNRSDDKGPEPEAVTLGEVNGKIYAFIGLERIGGIMIFDVSDPAEPQFIEYYNNRDFSAADEASDAAGDSAPEKIEFVPAAISPTSTSLIVVSNEVSGTVTTYSIGEAENPYTLAIFHNNDGESDLLPDLITVHGKEMMGGGIGQFKYTLDSLRDQAEDRGYASVMLSSGDNFLAGLEYNASLANGTFYDAIALDALDYDAIDLGNHDFDFGTEVLANFINAFETNRAPYLSSNLSFESVPELQALVDTERILPSTIINKNGEMIGVIGLTTPLLPSISSPGNTTVSGAIIDSVQQQVDILTEAGVNKIILISHLQSLAEEISLAGQVQGVDIIIAGGGDELLVNDATLGDPYNITPAGTYPVMAEDVNGDPVYVVTTPGNYRYLGNLLVDFNAEGVVTRVYNSDLVLITGQADSALVKAVEDPIREYIGELSTNVIAIAETDLDFRRETLRNRESNAGNLFADAILWQAQQTYEGFGVSKRPQVAIQNSGGLRLEALVEAGPLTEDLTYDIAAFTNIVSVVEDISPEKFLELIEHGVANAPALDGRFPQIAGFEIVYDQGMPAGERVISITLDDGTEIVKGGQVVTGASALTLATIDFTAGGGDGYPFAPLTFTTLGATYQQAFFNYLTSENGLDSLITAAQYPFGMNERILVEITQGLAVGSIDEGFNDCPALPEGWVEYHSDADLIACAGSSDPYMLFNGYGAGSGVSWLISPRITLDADDYSLSFYSSNQFSGPEAEVVYSTDYSGVGDPSAATWTSISEAKAAINSNTSGTLLESGNIDLSFIEEEAYIAFRYTSQGGSGGQSTRLKIDNIVVDVREPVLNAGRKSIPEIQGSGMESPYINNVVVTGGIVTAFFNNVEPYTGAGYNANINGFYIQDAEGDDDVNTSDGIFVASDAVVAVGDSISFKATVMETFGLTQLGETDSLIIRNSANELPAVTLVDLPEASPDDFEKYEGMLVQFSGELTVSGNYNLDQYGELILSEAGMLYQATQIIDPNDDPSTGVTANGNANVAAVADYLALNAARSILLDDAREGSRNRPVPFIGNNETLRAGSTVNDLQGIFTYGFGKYRLMPTVSPVFELAERPEVPSVGDSRLKVVAFNVLNYFNGDGQGGGYPTSRGASTEEEFAKQTQKIVAALTALDGDVVGLMEIENDEDNGNSAIKSLVDSLNAALGSDVYSFIETGIIGRHSGAADEIKVGFIYKPGSVTPHGDYAILDNGFDANFNDEYNRPALAQSFKENATGEVFTAVVNHLKSKGSDCEDLGDADDNDGQGNCNGTRTVAAGTLASWLETDPTGSADPDFLIIGDLNAYAQEDPIDTLRSVGYTALLEDTDFTYIFEGQYGALDQGLASEDLAPQVVEAAVWHINSEEPYMLRYNGVEDYFSPDAYYSSDHDPIIIGLNLDGEEVTGIDELAGQELKIYPNPSTGLFNVNKAVSGRVVNGLGSTVMETHNATEINLEHYSPGLYYLLLEEGGTFKILLQ